MAGSRLFNVGDRVIINLSRNDNAVSYGMYKYNGKEATISRLCRAIGQKRKKELDEELKDLRQQALEKPSKELTMEIEYREDILARLWTPHGYELTGVTSTHGVPYTFMNHMIKLVESKGE